MAILASLGFIKPGNNAFLPQVTSSPNQVLVTSSNLPETEMKDAQSAEAVDIENPGSENTVDLKQEPEIVKTYPIMNRYTKYYDVTGISKSDLCREMDKHGLPSKKNQIVYAIHVGGPMWTYKYYGINGQCFVTEPSVVLNSTITYPRWLDQRKASDSTKRWWKNLLEALKKHEETHRNNAADATIEISNLLNGYGGPCKTLVSDISVKTKAILDDLEKKQDKFDDSEQNEGALCH